ncbi:hypothetical protein GGX14DRAFT_429712 [Mycena pura]|uniref:Shugoshin C-terminal domain-containing protein n=1 Tax=Mycena pura TaxID=153505 RepID=A0AAD6VSJ0_9AGAR|nr:hypothetical protein GGX14DRAFT_429712 [Mycena pura]
MNRRESRVSMGARQIDALVEFESFKKKALLVNKHITKLNSTLSMKIEELNTEISTLYTENLRLRQSEINLTTQLKRERAKSRQVLSDAEAATQALSAHLTSLRDTFGISASTSPTPTPPRRATPSPRTSTYSNNPTVNRLSREPQVPNINEDEEPEDVQLSPPRKNKKKRLSASRLPLPARSGTPPIAPEAPTILALAPPPAHLDLSAIALPPKKRRQSGLLLDLAVVDLDTLEVDDCVESARENERDCENERQKEKERRRAVRDIASKPKPKLKDVTNANPPRVRAKVDPALEPIPTPRPLPLENLVQAQARSFLVAAPPSPPLPEPKPVPVPAQMVVPQPVSSGSSSSLEPATDREQEQERACGVEPVETGPRERRVRKSVNYAEPKLNTKMRKPEPPEGSAPAPAPKRARSSTSAVPARSSPPLPRRRAVGMEEEGKETDDEDDEQSDSWADGEYIPSWASMHVNFEGRRRVQHGGRRKGEIAAGEGRRHSSAV